MATSTISFSRLLPKPQPPSRSCHRPIRIPSPPPPFSLTRRRLPRLISAVQDNGGSGGTSETLDEEQQQGQEKKLEETKVEGKGEGSKVAEELKAAMAARRKNEEKDDLIGGVLEEVREIEWPPFGKVVGTTGVVLAVIAGSSVALLTVNAVLAELSDRIFAGKGVQDFFG